MTLRRIRSSALAATVALVALLLAACSMPTQYDPPAQNSGSPQNSAGTFLVDDPNIKTVGINTPVTVFDSYSTVSMELTVTNVTTSTDSANLNKDENVLPDGYRYLLVDISLRNTSTQGSDTCPNKQCTEYISPLSNFRLFDNQQRQWHTTTGATEDCTGNHNATCYNRLWVNEATSGIAPGATFTSRLAFLIPADVNTYALYFAPYRMIDDPSNASYAGGSPTAPVTTTTSPVATTAKGTPASTGTAVNGRTTLARVTISV